MENSTNSWIGKAVSPALNLIIVFREPLRRILIENLSLLQDLKRSRKFAGNPGPGGVFQTAARMESLREL